MTQPPVTVGVYIILRAKRPLIQGILRALIDDSALVATKWQAVLFVLKKILAHFRPNFFEQVSQMRRDRIVAQNRVARLNKIDCTEQSQASKDCNEEEEKRSKARLQGNQPGKEQGSADSYRVRNEAGREWQKQGPHWVSNPDRRSTGHYGLMAAFVR